MIETEKCKICNNKIDPDEYFTNHDESYYLCSEECAVEQPHLMEGEDS